MIMIRVVPLAVLMTLLLPPASYVATTASSMTIGLLLAALAWLLLSLATNVRPYVVEKSEVYSLGMLLGFLLLLTVHVFLSNMKMGGVNFSRFFLSCVILTLIFLGARFAAKKIAAVPVEHLVKTANLALVTLTLLAIAALLGVPAIGPQGSTEKAVVVFAEPSHFSLAYIPLLMFRVSVARPSTQALLTSVALVIALLLQSMTMIAGILMVAAVLLRRTPLVLMVLVLAAALLSVDLTYYTSRLMLSSESDNLSTLVLLQGWERAILALQATSGLGVGFQQFGIVGPIGEIAEKIAVMLRGDYVNLLDGGSTATKLIGEFGILGIVALLAFLRKAWRGARFVRRSQLLPPQRRDVRTLFLYSFVVAYAVELFLRGTGYFSPGGFLALTALLSLSSQRAAAHETAPRGALVGTQTLTAKN